MIRRVAALGLALILGGCASPPVVAPEQIEAELPVAWTLQGRIGIQTDEQSLSGQIRWQHRAETDELMMMSPLGQGIARIVRDAAGVTLEVPDQPVRRARDVESLTHETLGYTLPVSGLVWWVLARPAPDRVFEATHDNIGRILQLKQDGWVID
jgi:outer membrane lipoprotein LolB